MGKRAVPDSRLENMAYLYTHGKTLAEIGSVYSLSRERVRQILEKTGITRNDGGQNVRILCNIRYKQNKPSIFRYFETYGCTREEAELINGGQVVSTKGSPAHKYGNQRNNARKRQIEWQISFPEWVLVWKESGKFEQRGRGKGYCMARIGDSGPYSVDNVEIITIGQNFSDSYLVNPWHERFKDCVRVYKTHCVRGHERTPENIAKGGNCKTCNYLRNKLARAKQREAP